MSSAMVWRLGVLAVFVWGCQATPPPRWAEGGARLELPSARWTRGEGAAITITPEGEVRRGKQLLFLLDSAGRVFEADKDPVALLDEAGHVIGTDSERLGRVGYRNASPPWSSIAWLRVASDGTLMLFDGEGQPVYGGRWRGCAGAAVRACTLVSHLIWLDAYKRYVRELSHRPSPFGVGAGVWY